MIWIFDLIDKTIMKMKFLTDLCIVKYAATACLCLLTINIHGQGMHPEKQIAEVKHLIKAENTDVIAAYRVLKVDADNALKSSPHAMEDFSVPGRYVDSVGHMKNAKPLQVDAYNAYACALFYRLSGEKKYADKSCEILNDWANVNKRFSASDGPLVMTYSGTGLMNAALLLKNDVNWKAKDKKAFTHWMTDVYKRAADSIRYRKNNWADWGRYGSLLAASYMGDKTEVGVNCRLIKADMERKIAVDGAMTLEVNRGANSLWYTYFSLAPMTASAWIIYNETGENLFDENFNGASIKKALDYLLYYCNHPGEWKFYKNPNLPIRKNRNGKLSDATVSQVPEKNGGWPFNLFEAMKGVYHDKHFADFTQPERPIFYSIHHFAWTFPTLMPTKIAQR